MYPIDICMLCVLYTRKNPIYMTEVKWWYKTVKYTIQKKWDLTIYCERETNTKNNALFKVHHKFIITLFSIFIEYNRIYFLKKKIVHVICIYCIAKRTTKIYTYTSYA